MSRLERLADSIFLSTDNTCRVIYISKCAMLINIKYNVVLNNNERVFVPIIVLNKLMPDSEHERMFRFSRMLIQLSGTSEIILKMIATYDSQDCQIPKF